MFWHVSRVDDIIKSRGYRVSRRERWRTRLHEHQAVLESTVIGVPDPEQGQRVKAFVILKDGLRRVAGAGRRPAGRSSKKRVAPYMSPSEIEFVDSLPRTETGKVRRVELRELEARREEERQARALARRARWRERARLHVPARPRSLEEACALLPEHGSEGKVLAGGTDLLVKMKHRRLAALLLGQHQADSRARLHPLRAGRRSAHRSSCHASNRSSGLWQVRKKYPVLHQAAAYMATVAIRNRATRGGQHLQRLTVGGDGAAL